MSASEHPVVWSWTESRWFPVILACMCALLFYTNLGAAGLWDEDEPRNGTASTEMLQRGDWVVPTFNGEYRTQKPVLLYWLQMLAYQVYGINEFGARFPSATLSIGTVLLVWLMGCKLHSRAVGAVASMMFAGALMFTVSARASTPDGCLIFGVTWTLAMYVWGCSTSEPGSFGKHTFIPLQWWQMALVYAGMGWSMLAKGPVGILLPTAIIGLFVLLARSVKSKPLSWLQKIQLMLHELPIATWLLRPLLAAIIILAIAAPWYIMVHLRTDGVWTRTFFGFENWERFKKPMENHSGGPWYYLVAILAGFFPWSIFLPVAIWRAFQQAWQYGAAFQARTFLLVWVCVWVGVFTIAQTKLPSYVLPAYPAIALLTAIMVVEWLQQPALISRKLVYSAWATLILVGIILAVGLPMYLQKFIPVSPWLFVLGVIPAVSGFVAGVFYYRDQSRSAVQTVFVMSGLFSLAFFAGAVVHVSQFQNSQHLLAQIRSLSQEYVQPQPAIATFCYPESSVIYYARQPVLSTGEPATIAQFFTDREQAYVITTSREYEEKLKSQLPAEIEILYQEPRFLKQGEQTLLLGRKPRIAEQFPTLRR